MKTTWKKMKTTWKKMKTTWKKIGTTWKSSDQDYGRTSPTQYVLLIKIYKQREVYKNINQNKEKYTRTLIKIYKQREI